MLKTGIFWSLGLMAAVGMVRAQGIQYVDSLPVDSGLKKVFFQVHVPLGQTFLQPATRKNMFFVRASMPDHQMEPVFHAERQGTQCSGILGWVNPDQNVADSRPVSRGGTAARATYQSNSLHVSGEPSAYLMQMEAAPGVPLDLDLNLGYGSSRLDLSGLSISTLHVVSASTDVVVTWQQINGVGMDQMFIDGGMSRIVLRNVEFSRARYIKIANGMGTTRIILGNQVPYQGTLDVEVGAGSCDLLLEESVPCKIVFVTAPIGGFEVPEGFVQTDDMTYVNLPFKSQPNDGVTVMADVGIGSFVVTTHR